MSISAKTPNSIRQVGPGASHEKAKAPLEVKKPPGSDHNNPGQSGHKPKPTSAH